MFEPPLEGRHGTLEIAGGKILFKRGGADNLAVEFNGCTGRGRDDLETLRGCVGTTQEQCTEEERLAAREGKHGVLQQIVY